MIDVVAMRAVQALDAVCRAYTELHNVRPAQINSKTKGKTKGNLL